MDQAITLSAFDVRPVIERRRENYAVLAATLSEFALFDGVAIEFTPFGFPVRVEALTKAANAAVAAACPAVLSIASWVPLAGFSNSRVRETFANPVPLKSHARWL